MKHISLQEVVAVEETVDYTTCDVCSTRGSGTEYFAEQYDHTFIQWRKNRTFSQDVYYVHICASCLDAIVKNLGITWQGGTGEQPTIGNPEPEVETPIEEIVTEPPVEEPIP